MNQLERRIFNEFVFKTLTNKLDGLKQLTNRNYILTLVAIGWEVVGGAWQYGGASMSRVIADLQHKGLFYVP